ncbi:MAG: hypothetical protein Q7R70_04110 [Candidatus Diapherotrites archaeon]|nr:hypothetical protein [Candidatus Diapherotrites archaeon]
MTKKSIFEESNAQTGIEYLLILAGAIIVVAVVGFILKGMAQGTNTVVNERVNSTE